MKTRATSTPACSCPTPRRCSAPRKPRGRSRKSSWTRPALQYVSSVMGYSMLSGVNATYSSFFFISLQAVGRTQDPGDKLRRHQSPSAARPLASPGRIAFSFPPPAIPGVGTSGGATFILEDRSGSGIEFLAKNTQLFMAEAPQTPGVGRRDDQRPCSASPRSE